MGAAAARMLRALVRRATEGDTEALEQLVKLEALTSTALTVAMVQAHDWADYSWTQVATAVGTTRQAARQRAERGKLFPDPAQEWLLG